MMPEPTTNVDPHCGSRPNSYYGGSRPTSRDFSSMDFPRNDGKHDSKVELKVDVKDDDMKTQTTVVDNSKLAEELPPDLPEDDTLCMKAYRRRLHALQNVVHGFLKRSGGVLKKLAIALLVVAYFAYLVWAYVVSRSEANGIIAFSLLVVAWFLMKLLWRFVGTSINKTVCAPLAFFYNGGRWKYVKWTIYAVLLTGLILFLIIDVGNDPMRLTSAAGLVILLLLVFVTSTNPAMVQWRPVLWGVGLQFLLGVLILRWRPGFVFFQFLGNRVKVFLDFTNKGSEFVFGEHYHLHEMAFKIFPIVIYFSAVISVLYYWGCMQFVVCKIAWLMQFTMGTTAIESLNAATNIFIGMAESCIILRPYLPVLTKSELHAVMTGGFATVAGSYIALLVEVGASPEHLLAAAIMSAPAALAMAKLSYPETEVSHTKTEDDVYMEKTPARNVVEAASSGAIAAIKVVASVGANLIALIALIEFMNAMLGYFGRLVGFPFFSFETICEVLFWPLAYIMGVGSEYSSKVAKLIGMKIFADELISFQTLGKMIGDGELDPRSTMIATFACCGFGSIAAVGVYIGALVSVAPSRRGDISEVAFRAMANGNIAGFLTACIAGLLYKGEGFHQLATANATTPFLNATGATWSPFAQ